MTTNPHQSPSASSDCPEAAEAAAAQKSAPSSPRWLAVLILPLLVIGVLRVAPCIAQSQFSGPVTGDEIARHLEQHPELKAVMKRYDHVLATARDIGSREFFYAACEVEKRNALAATDHTGAVPLVGAPSAAASTESTVSAQP